MPKSTSAEMDARIAAVYRKLLEGARRHDIMQYNKDAGWNVCESMVDRYIALATAEIAEVTELEKQTALGMAYKRLDMLFSEAHRDKDFKTCLAIQRELNELGGLKIIKQEISGNMGIQFVNNVPEDATKPDHTADNIDADEEY
jgi:hypothetical protein